MVDAVRALSQQEKDAKKQQAHDFTMNASLEELKAMIASRTLEEQTAFFALFDNAEQFFDWNKTIPAARKDEYYHLYTPEHNAMIQEAWKAAFGAIDNTVILQKTAEFYNTGSDGDLAIMCKHQNKFHLVQFLQRFANVAEFEAWKAGLNEGVWDKVQALRNDEGKTAMLEA